MVQVPRLVLKEGVLYFLLVLPVIRVLPQSDNVHTALQCHVIGQQHADHFELSLHPTVRGSLSHLQPVSIPWHMSGRRSQSSHLLVSLLPILVSRFYLNLHDVRKAEDERKGDEKASELEGIKSCWESKERRFE